jgi:hypothetical protein
MSYNCNKFICYRTVSCVRLHIKKRILKVSSLVVNFYTTKYNIKNYTPRVSLCVLYHPSLQKKKDERRPSTFERKILRRMYGTICGRGQRRKR